MILVRHGWHGLVPLSYLILDERQVRKWQDYTATTMWLIGRRLFGENWTLEPYMEFAYPEKIAVEETPEQIKDRIVRRLTA